MNQGVPWNVTGVRPDARDVAREAARRSGMSVGDWLNSVIDIAAGARTRHRGQDMHQDLPAQAGDDQIARVYDRLDQMAHRLESLAQVAGARAQAEPADATGGRFASAISQFDDRLDRLMSEGRAAANELERRLAAFDGARSHVARVAQRPAPAPHYPPQAPYQQHQQAQPAYPQ